LRILTEFFTDWRTTGAVVGTSRFTRDKMFDRLDWRNVRTAVELGPGTGCVTRSILGRLPRTARLVALEINPRFVHRLRNEVRDERLAVVEGSACQLPRLLREQGLPQADLIVSTLPFSTLAPALRREIVRAATEALSSEGRLVAIQYQPFVLPPLLQKSFGGVGLTMSWINVPPAFVYTCTLPTSPSA